MTDFRRTYTEEDDGTISIREPDLSSNSDPPPTWTVRIPLTIAPSSDLLTDFPVLVSLDSNSFDFSLAQADGSDIRFSLLEDPTYADWLASEIDVYDGATQGKIWVKLPLIKAGVADTVFYMFAGNIAAGDIPSGVFSAYQFALHGDDGDDFLVPLTANETGSRSQRPGRHFTNFPIADCREFFDPIDATGWTLEAGRLLIEIKCSDPNQLLDSLPEELGEETTETDHEGYEWVGGIGISSTDLDTGGAIKEVWRKGLRNLGIQRQYHPFNIRMDDWVYRSTTNLTGTCSTAVDGDDNMLGNSTAEIVGDGTAFTSELAEGDRILMRFPKAGTDQIWKVETINDDESLEVQGYAEETLGDNVGLNFTDRTMRKCNNDADFDEASIQHVRVVGHFKSHNVILSFRNARLTWPSGSTNVAADAAGNFDAQKTETANAVSVAGLLGNALEFDGTEGRLRLSRYLDMGDSSFTFSCWIKTDVGCGNIPLMGAEDMLFRIDTDGKFFLQFGKFQRNTVMTANVFNEMWHHVVIVRDRALNFFKLWVDGVLDVTVDDAGEDFDVDGFVYLVGNDEAETTEDFIGQIDEMRMLFEAKGESWIVNEYNAVTASIVAMGDVYQPEATPDGIALESEDGGAVYVS